jgi:hypothetical protein
VYWCHNVSKLRIVCIGVIVSANCELFIGVIVSANCELCVLVS